MIASDDRSYYIGASDTKTVMGKWTSATFQRWWRTKQGLSAAIPLKSKQVLAGRYWEHRILDSICVRGLHTDEQRIVRGRLRVNLDGSTKDTIYEVKTYDFSKGFKMPKEYIWQVNVEMFSFDIRNAYIVTYGLEEEDYDNYYRDLDIARLNRIPVEYNEVWVNEEYLPRLDYLIACLDKGTFPREDEYETYRRDKGLIP